MASRRRGGEEVEKAMIMKKWRREGDEWRVGMTGRGRNKKNTGEDDREVEKA